MKDVANLGGEPLQISVCADAAWLLSKEAFALYAPCLYQPTYESYRERMRGYLAAPGVVVGVGRVGDELVNAARFGIVADDGE